MQLTSKLWEAGIGAETQHKNNVKMLTQLQYCEDKQIDFAVVIAGMDFQSAANSGAAGFPSRKTSADHPFLNSK